MEMSLQQLRMLREVANRTTIAAAADSLGYTSSAVSQQLSGLEKATGVAVLERVGRNVRLTDAGRELVRHAEDLLAGMEAAQVAIERMSGEVRGVLHITVFESVAGTLLVPLLDRLKERHPELQLRTMQMDPDLAMDALASGELDLAFAIDYPHAPAPRRDDITRYSLMEDVLRLVVCEDDELADCTRVRMADLRDRPFISSPVNLSCGRCVVVACRDAGFEPDVAHQVDDFATSLHLVSASQGVALIPDLGLIDLPPHLRAIDIDPPVSRLIQLAYRATNVDRPAIVAVQDAMIEIVDELGLGQPLRGAA
jgi:DNA-binding transcriptional LysR family regulator